MSADYSPTPKPGLETLSKPKEGATGNLDQFNCRTNWKNAATNNRANSSNWISNSVA